MERSALDRLAAYDYSATKIFISINKGLAALLKKPLTGSAAIKPARRQAALPMW
jgi:hypothetical protein